MTTLDRPMVARHGAFEIWQGGTPQSFVVHAAGQMQTRYHILFVDGEITHGREANALQKYKPHIHAWATHALRNYPSTDKLESKIDELAN
jgi:hypothetical protein